MARGSSSPLGSSPTERSGHLRHTDARRRILVSGHPVQWSPAGREWIEAEWHTEVAMRNYRIVASVLILVSLISVPARAGGGEKVEALKLGP